MKHNFIRWVSAFAAVIFFAGCAGNAHIEKDKNVDFSNYKTYAWVDKPGVKEKGKTTNDLTEASVRNAVNEELRKKGWVEMKRKADVLINYELMVEKNEVEQKDPVYTQSYSRSYYNRSTGRVHTFYYPSQFVGYDSYSTTVKEGTVTITMIDSRTDKAVWQGWASTELLKGRITGKEIDRNVKAIFRKFDVGKS